MPHSVTYGPNFDQNRFLRLGPGNRYIRGGAPPVQPPSFLSGTVSNRLPGSRIHPPRQIGRNPNISRPDDPSLTSNIIGEFDPYQQPFVRGGLEGIQAGDDYNIDLLNRSLKDLAGLRGEISNLFNPVVNRANQLDPGLLQKQLSQLFGPAINQSLINLKGVQDLPIDPYSDELRGSNLTRLNEQATGDYQNLIDQTRQQFAGRGLINSGQAVGAEAQLGQGLLFQKQGNDLQTLLDQLTTNIGANQTRAGLTTQALNPLISATQGLGSGLLGSGQLGLQGLGIQGDIAGQFGSQLAGVDFGQASLLQGNRTDPLRSFNVTGDLLSGLLGQKNFQQVLDYANKINKANQPSFLNTVGDFFDFFPGGGRFGSAISHGLDQLLPPNLGGSRGGFIF